MCCESVVWASVASVLAVEHNSLGLQFLAAAALLVVFMKLINWLMKLMSSICRSETVSDLLYV